METFDQSEGRKNLQKQAGVFENLWLGQVSCMELNRVMKVKSNEENGWSDDSERPGKPIILAFRCMNLNQSWRTETSRWIHFFWLLLDILFFLPSCTNPVVRMFCSLRKNPNPIALFFFFLQEQNTFYLFILTNENSLSSGVIWPWSQCSPVALIPSA